MYKKKVPNKAAEQTWIKTSFSSEEIFTGFLETQIEHWTKLIAHHYQNQLKQQPYEIQAKIW